MASKTETIDSATQHISGRDIPLLCIYMLKYVINKT